VENVLKNPRWELFCRYYSGNPESIGNATKAYMLAYNLPQNTYGTANKNAYRLMVNEGILRRIEELQEVYMKKVDFELAFVIGQRKNLAAKVAALKEFYRKSPRVNGGIKKSQEVTFRWLEDK